MDSLDDFVHYDYLLKEPLAELGWEVHDVSWRAKEVNWSRFEVVIIRTPWDYQEDPEQFMQVLADIEDSDAILQNPLDMVQWNINKIYLRDLEKQGIRIVPTVWGAQPEELTKEQLFSTFDQFDAKEIVIKPTISAGAEDTFWLTRGSAEEKFRELQQIFSDKAFMIQPFMQHIVEEGEFSLIYFGEQYSHTLLKTPKQEDFRVQEEHGGRLTTVEPEPELRAVSDRLVQTVQPTPLYSRVDMVRDEDTFFLMELELIEPSLYFNMDPDSPQRFARFFDEWMQN